MASEWVILVPQKAKIFHPKQERKEMRNCLEICWKSQSQITLDFNQFLNQCQIGRYGIVEGHFGLLARGNMLLSIGYCPLDNRVTQEKTCYYPLNIDHWIKGGTKKEHAIIYWVLSIG